MQQTYIGLDVGRSAVKAMAYAEGRIYDLLFPSVVSLAIPISDEATAAKAEAETVEVNGKLFFTGDTARVQSGATTSTGLSNDWIESPEYHALVLSAMKRLKAKGVPGLDNAFIVVGTPAAQYRIQRERLEQVTKAAVNAEVKALSQPMGAYLSWAFNESGLPLQDKLQNQSGRKKSWAVVEVGYFSTDFLLMKEGSYIESKSQSCEGIYLASEHLVRILAEKRQMKVTPLECEQALRSKTVLHYGEKHVEAEVNEAAEFVVTKIMAKANFLFSDEVSKLDGILIAGGGAPLVSPSLQKKWPNSIVLPQPRMAVADGFLRHARALGLKRAVAGAQQAKVQA
ncbi:MAG TPA: ParM/StbA family protein [Noviherbaspirillum sp.]|uniref:ParM/StbA family protein n=1 Tax=Noviherbaspirillum sp. TaxID=1926288 RepID=UPI002B48D87F|nr:ParM/StbA family protein [Noviherbaspirillum sp.]HJV84549.1 ParM/StbA family protein [Noviherbaspirillum sp.]